MRGRSLQASFKKVVTNSVKRHYEDGSYFMFAIGIHKELPVLDHSRIVSDGSSGKEEGS